MRGRSSLVPHHAPAKRVGIQTKLLSVGGLGLDLTPPCHTPAMEGLQREKDWSVVFVLGAPGVCSFIRLQGGGLPALERAMGSVVWGGKEGGRQRHLLWP